MHSGSFPSGSKNFYNVIKNASVGKRGCVLAKRSGSMLLRTGSCHFSRTYSEPFFVRVLPSQESLLRKSWHLFTAHQTNTTTLDKKRTIIEIRGEKNAVPRVISCSIRRDQRRASPIRDCPRLLPCADRAWYHTWNSVLLAANLDDGSFFVKGSKTTLTWEYSRSCLLGGD